ncbi:twin-arginine translocase TatA/TatE family subunit [bacterium]|nr:twin-arginine translocase TatA/TatE family subunit [bacterium]
MSLGMPEIVILLVIALLIFGPSRLPGLGKSMGEAIRGFKKGVDGASDKDITDEESVESERLASSREASSQKSKVKQEDHS